MEIIHNGLKYVFGFRSSCVFILDDLCLFFAVVFVFSFLLRQVRKFKYRKDDYVWKD